MSEAQVQAEESEENDARENAPNLRLYSHNGRRMTGEVDRTTINSYNFRNPGFLRLGDLRLFEVLHQKFLEHLSARLSTFLRIDCVLKMLKFGSSTFKAFAETMKTTTHITLFKIDFLRGTGILDMSLPLSLAIADRMLGGRGSVRDANRGLTEIEMALVQDVVQLILVEWTLQWPEQDVMTFNPVILEHETSGKFLQTAEADAVHVTIQAEVVLGECIGQLQMGIPLAMVEPIVKVMSAARLKDSQSKTRTIEWRRPFNGIEVPVTAEWVVKDMPISEVIRLRPGDVLEMNRDLIAQTRVRFSNTTEFIGTAGVEDGRVAVRLTQRKPLE